MRMTFLYGPPAVGKLTIAEELAKLTGDRLLHNHLTVDLIASLYEWGSPNYWKNLRALRERLLGQLAKDGVDVIFTYVYAAGLDEKVMERMFGRIEKYGGEVKLIRLTADVQTLKARIANDSRKKYRKMTETAALDEWLGRYSLFQAFPTRPSLTVETDRYTPAEAAQTIARYIQHAKG